MPAALVLDPHIAKVSQLLLNRRAYVESRLAIRDEKGKLLRLSLNAAQKYLYGIQARRRLILKSRRIGVTTWEHADSFWRVVTKSGQHVASIAHDAESTERQFRIATTFYDHLEPAFRPRRLTEHSKRSLNFPDLGSIFDIGTAGARGFGRGDTFQKIHWSEVAHSPGKIEDQRSLLAGMTEAARNGDVVLETTANGVGGLFHELWSEASEGGTEWTAIFIPWWMDERNVLPVPVGFEPTQEERELALRNQLTSEQLAWRRAKKAELKQLFDQEYPESAQTAFLVTGETFINALRIMDLLRDCGEPLETRPEGVRIWKRPEPGRAYSAGADPAEGVPHRDYSVCAVLDARSMEQVACLRGRWTPDEFARRSAKLATEYNKSLIIPERNNHGHTMILALRTAGYSRVYHHQDYTGSGATDPGWPTNVKTRPILMDGLRKSLEPGMMRIHDRVFLDELRTFQPGPDGIYRARDGRYDDSVFGWALAVQGRESALAGHPLPKVEPVKSDLQKVHAYALQNVKDRIKERGNDRFRVDPLDG